MNRRGSRHVVRACAFLQPFVSESLERRVLFASELPPPNMAESEPNDVPENANAVAVSPSAPFIVGGQLGGGDNQDWFSFTLSEASGVFLDVDALEVGLKIGRAS